MQFGLIHLQLMDDAYITSHVNILLPPIFIHKSCTVLKYNYFFSTAFTLLFFVGPNWLHFRSDLVPGPTYDKLIEKKLFVSLLCLPVGYEMYDMCSRQETLPLYQPLSPKIQQSLSSFQAGTTSQKSKLGIPRS